MDSLRKRYFYKLVTNAVGLVVGVVTAGVIPRGLGPKAFGDFNFLSSFFGQTMGFLDMGTSTCFYTKLSQKPKDTGLVSFYALFGLVISVAAAVFVFVCLQAGAGNRLWPGQQTVFIYAALIWGVLTWVSGILAQMADARMHTVHAEIAKVVQKILGLGVIVALFWAAGLTLMNFFYYHYMMSFILILALVTILKRGNADLSGGLSLPAGSLKGYLKEFYDYTHPLFTYALVTVIVGIFDRWLLQRHGGSIQQGFFGFSFQIGSICLLFTTAMTPLLMREFSIAFEENNDARMRELFHRHIPVLFSITAFFACFVAVQSRNVSLVMGGKDYGEASIAVAIMAFYPVYQTYGQLTGSVFYATGKTRLYRNIGISVLVAGLPITYFLIAPRDGMGLNAGATGLALKMLVIAFLGVNVMLYYSTKILGLRYFRYLIQQVVSVGCLLVLAAGATLTVQCILSRFAAGAVMGLACVGVIYATAAFLVACSSPAIFGLRRGDMRRFLFMCGLKRVDGD